MKLSNLIKHGYLEDTKEGGWKEIEKKWSELRSYGQKKN